MVLKLDWEKNPDVIVDDHSCVVALRFPVADARDPETGEIFMDDSVEFETWCDVEESLRLTFGEEVDGWSWPDYHSGENWQCIEEGDGSVWMEMYLSIDAQVDSCPGCVKAQAKQEREEAHAAAKAMERQMTFFDFLPADEGVKA